MMTPQELDAKINELTVAAKNLSGLAKVYAMNDLDEIKDKRDSMALGEIRQILDQMQLPDLQELDTKIDTANTATASQQARVDAINSAIGILKVALRVVI